MFTRSAARRRFVAMAAAGMLPAGLGSGSRTRAAAVDAVHTVQAVHALHDEATATPGRILRFPADEGSHPQFRLEWWYVTGWLVDEAKRDLGFQLTFFRNRVGDMRGNPSRFAAGNLILAHAALSDPRRGRLLHAQQVGRAAFGLADAGEGRTDVHIGKWSLRAEGAERLRAVAIERELRLELDLQRTQPPLLQGDAGFSRKGPSPESASHYYTLPHLLVAGAIATGSAAPQRVTGVAWLDHEWSSAYMEKSATGWDWIGINLDDGGALMAFRMRDAGGRTLWNGATLRDREGRTTSFDTGQVRWNAVRTWQSSRTGAAYPVEWRIGIGQLDVTITPLFDDQEQDARATTGTVYWEGAVTAHEGDRVTGRGYLELTGYWRSFRI